MPAILESHKPEINLKTRLPVSHTCGGCWGRTWLVETCLQVELKHFASGRFFYVFCGKRGRESGASSLGRLQEPEMKSERLRESLGRSFSPIAIWIWLQDQGRYNQVSSPEFQRENSLLMIMRAWGKDSQGTTFWNFGDARRSLSEYKQGTSLGKTLKWKETVWNIQRKIVRRHFLRKGFFFFFFAKLFW